MERRLISVREAAGMLGLSPWTLYSWHGTHVFPFIKMGRRLMVDLKDLERVIERQRVPAKEEKG